MSIFPIIKKTSIERDDIIESRKKQNAYSMLRLMITSVMHITVNKLTLQINSYKKRGRVRDE